MSGYYCSRKDYSRNRISPGGGEIWESQRPVAPWWLLGLPFLAAAMLGAAIGILAAHGAIP